MRNSQSLPPEANAVDVQCLMPSFRGLFLQVFKASIRKMVESPTSKASAVPLCVTLQNVLQEGPELQSSAPFFQRQNKKSMARLTGGMLRDLGRDGRGLGVCRSGPALRALADMEALTLSRWAVPCGSMLSVWPGREAAAQGDLQAPYPLGETARRCRRRHYRGRDSCQKTRGPF